MILIMVLIGPKAGNLYNDSKHEAASDRLDPVDYYD